MTLNARFTFVVRMLFSVFMLGLVTYTVDFGRAWDMLVQLPLWYFFASILYQFLLLIIIAFRWWIIAPGASFTRLLEITVRAQFVVFLFPSSITVDAFRLWSLRSDSAGLVGNTAIIVVDKIAGMVAILIVFGLAGVCAALPNAMQGLFYLPVVLSLSFGTLLCAIICFIPMQQIYSSFTNTRLGKMIVTRLSNSVLAYSEATFSAIKGTSRKRVSASLAVALLYQAIMIVGYLLVSIVFDIRLTVSQMLFVSSLMQVVMFVPLSIAGIGIKDLSLVYLLVQFGVHSDIAYAATLSSYPVSLALALLGWLTAIVSSNRGPVISQIDIGVKHNTPRNRDL